MSGRLDTPSEQQTNIVIRTKIPKNPSTVPSQHKAWSSNCHSKLMVRSPLSPSHNQLAQCHKRHPLIHPHFLDRPSQDHQYKHPHPSLPILPRPHPLALQLRIGFPTSLNQGAELCKVNASSPMCNPRQQYPTSSI